MYECEPEEGEREEKRYLKMGVSQIVGNLDGVITCFTEHTKQKQKPRRSRARVVADINHEHIECVRENGRVPTGIGIGNEGKGNAYTGCGWNRNKQTRGVYGETLTNRRRIGKGSVTALSSNEIRNGNENRRERGKVESHHDNEY